MCCNSFDEQTILLSLFGNRALYLIYEHEAIQKPISENNIGAPSAPQKDQTTNTQRT